MGGTQEAPGLGANVMPFILHSQWEAALAAGWVAQCPLFARANFQFLPHYA